MVVRHWAVTELTGLDTDPERARARLVDRLRKSERVARRLCERRHELDRSPTG